jgi:hypothetical protein
MRASSVCNRNRELVLELAEAGHSLSAIGRKIGTKNQCVRAFLRENLPSWEVNKDTSGARNNHWKGGRSSINGYALIQQPDHPHANRHGYVLEHRLVMEKMIGRFLEPQEVVHHRNKNKQDNSPANLQLFSENSEHLKHELTGKVPNWTPDGLLRISQAVSLSNRRRKNNHQSSTPDAAP